MKAKGVDSGGGRRLQQQPLSRKNNEATAAAAASTAASGLVGMRAAFLLRRTKIMEFSGTNQNTLMGRNIKNKKGPFDQSFFLLLCFLFPTAGFPSLALFLCISGRSSSSHFMFYFSLLRLLSFYSLPFYPAFHVIISRPSLLLCFDGGRGQKYRRTCIRSLCYFSQLRPDNKNN